VRVSTSTRSVSSFSRTGWTERHHDVTSMSRTSRAAIPNSGQNNQKPNPVTTQTNVRIAPHTLEIAAWMDRKRHERGPFSERRIA